MGCYIWYSEEGTGRSRNSPRPLLAVPNVTALPITVAYCCKWSNALRFQCALKGLKRLMRSLIRVRRSRTDLETVFYCRVLVWEYTCLGFESIVLVPLLNACLRLVWNGSNNCACAPQLNKSYVFVHIYEQYIELMHGKIIGLSSFLYVNTGFLKDLSSANCEMPKLEAPGLMQQFQYKHGIRKLKQCHAQFSI